MSMSTKKQELPQNGVSDAHETVVRRSNNQETTPEIKEESSFPPVELKHRMIPEDNTSSEQAEKRNRDDVLLTKQDKLLRNPNAPPATTTPPTDLPKKAAPSDTSGLIEEQVGILRDVAPLPTPLLQRSTPGGATSSGVDMSIPGAYAFAPGQPVDLPASSDDYDGGDTTMDPLDTNNNDNSAGLAVAREIDGDLEASMQRAVEQEAPIGEQTDPSHKKEEEKVKECKTYAFIGGIIVFASLALVVAFVVGGSSSTTTSDSDSAAAAAVPTTVPSMAPSMYSPEDIILPLLPEYTVASIENDRESPQAKAFQWMVEDPQLTSYIYTTTRILQRFSLATLFFASNGKDWTDNNNWLNHSVHECDWYSKGEFALKTETSKLYPGYMGKYTPPPTICNEDDESYQNLWLDKNNLVGSLPLELWLLTSLRSISLSQNFLSGQITSHVGQLSNLTGFGIMHNEDITGSIPPQFASLSGLRVLDLTNNNHGGSIPSELWKLTNLQYLNLSQNKKLVGTLPSELGTFSNLTWFLANDCSLTGTFPTEMGLLESLEWIVLLENGFSGTLPTELGNLSKLLLVSLFGNSFTGSLPTELAKLSSTFLLTLRDNQLTGPVPSQFGQLTNLISTLNLRNNLLSGTIPSDLGLLTKLQELELLKNRLTGQIPTEIGQLTSVDILTFANNSLTGTIPEELAGLPLLQTIKLEGNPTLSGTIPPALCDLRGICVGNALDWCEDATGGLSFDCTDLLCDCNCSSCI